MKKRTSGIFATALTAVLSLALLGSAAAAAFAPGDASVTGDHAPDTSKVEEVLNGLVDGGMISAELRDAILAKLAEAGHDEEDENTEEDEDGDNEDGDEEEDEDNEDGDKGKGKDKNGKRDLEPKLRFDVHRLIGGWQKAVVEYLGLERKELFERLRAGETFGGIADTLEDKSAAGLTDALQTPAFAKVDTLVGDEKLTAEQGEKAKERVTLAIEKILAREFPAKPRVAQEPKTERENADRKPAHANPGKPAHANPGKKPAHANPGKRP